MTRDQVAMTVFLSVVGALLLFPPLALLALRLIRSRGPRAVRRSVLGCAGFIIVVWLGAWAGFGLPSRAAGCYAILAAYGAFCFLVAASRLARPRALGLAMGSAGWTVIAIGYVVATLGFLPLGWIVMDLAEPSSSSEQVAPRLTCETSYWGMAAGASGYVQHLYEAWPPGLRREVASYSVMQTEPADSDVSCAEAYRRYRDVSGR